MQVCWAVSPTSAGINTAGSFKTIVNENPVHHTYSCPTTELILMSTCVCETPLVFSSSEGCVTVAEEQGRTYNSILDNGSVSPPYWSRPSSPHSSIQWQTHPPPQPSVHLSPQTTSAYSEYLLLCTDPFHPPQRPSASQPPTFYRFFVSTYSIRTSRDREAEEHIVPLCFADVGEMYDGCLVLDSVGGGESEGGRRRQLDLSGWSAVFEPTWFNEEE